MIYIFNLLLLYKYVPMYYWLFNCYTYYLSPFYKMMLLNILKGFGIGNLNVTTY